MSEQQGFLLRKVTGDQPVGTEQNIREWLQKGQCKPADLLFDFAAGRWTRVGDHPSLADLFSHKPAQNPERKLIYFMSPGAGALPQGPYSTKEVQGRVQTRDICESTWIFVEGDKEWRQVKNVKVLREMLPALPAEVPARPKSEEAGSPSIDLDLSMPMPGDGDRASLTNALEGLEMPAGGLGAPPAAPSPPPEFPVDISVPAGDADVEREDPTMAFSVLGLNLETASAMPPVEKSAPPPPPKPFVAPPAPPAAKPAAAPAAANPPRQTLVEKEKDTGSFDGLTAQIPMEPIWLVKRGNLETVAGPFRFLEVIKLLEEGKLNKNDKISREGSNRFVKIQQQYEFNVKFVVETVVENGVERQRIVIKRRHPRVPYLTDVQITTPSGVVAAACVNISAGGLLIEMAKGEFSLGQVVEIKVLPSLINKTIACRAMVVGKIPRMPPGYALNFENLKPEDKEAIEFFVSEALKREMQKNS